MELTQEELVWLFENVSEAINKISETVKELAKAIKEAIDKTVILLQEACDLIKKQQKSSKAKIILKKLSPKNICKRIKQFMKRRK